MKSYQISFLLLLSLSFLDASITVCCSCGSVGDVTKPKSISSTGNNTNTFLSFVVVAIISLVSIIIHKLREYSEANSTFEEKKDEPLATVEQPHARCLSLCEIRSATLDFNEGNVVGEGGFGKVYAGLVAVKRATSDSKQGEKEFLTEIQILSKLRHVNLVSLVGYCDEDGEKILVYEFLAGGTLDHRLIKPPSGPPLTWKQRLGICIGASRGLDYLHREHGVMHGDVKAANILLDHNMVAKLVDFGMAKPEDGSKLRSHVTSPSALWGTKGYADPYPSDCTRESDTYAFGVLLFEVLCGRPAVLDLESNHLLTAWVQEKISKKEVDQIVDPRLREEISPDSLETFVEVAERCLQYEPKNRPTMSQVVRQLQIALEQ